MSESELKRRKALGEVLTPDEEAKIEGALRKIWGRMYAPPEREGRYKTLDEEAEILRSLVLDIKRAEREAIANYLARTHREAAEAMRAHTEELDRASEKEI